jgi:NTP pyrophosphatase (non-canonical NTP hydrolase)
MQETKLDTEAYNEKLRFVTNNIIHEVKRAKTLFPNNFVNQHEAYAVILEEVDELWDEIKKNQRNYDLEAQRKEATQAAAMLCRLLVELL